MESKPLETRDLPALARERVQVGPAAAWVDSTWYDRGFAPKIRSEITYLLQDIQINAELGQTYVHKAMRLESQRTVQASSQWRIGIEPQTQSIVLHSIKIRRDDVETEHASLERLQFLQREAGLERFEIHGSITILLLLEDVRPGDILEFSYTLSNQPRVMPEYLTAFFSLPVATEIGKYRFLIRHAERRVLKWKASSPKFIPKISADNGEVCCYWIDLNFASPEPEGCVPAWHLMFPWIQVSDCPDWQIVARAVLAEWEKQLPGDGVAAMVKDIENFNPDTLARVTRAIELVQDGFRYLSVNLELGGQIPAAPETVVRRRYGDCKDLAFLLVHVLRGLGVPARPVIVDTMFLKSIGSLLPSPTMFNHVVVEFEIGSEKRWVDCTAKNQGGGALNRCITDFGMGLPIDAATTELALVPRGSLNAGTYELKESFILDSTGKPSLLAIIITTTGAAADVFRTEFVNAGIDVIAKNRLQGCANRFNKASRVKPLECHDDRDANEFVLAEAFEILSTLLEHKPSRTCLFQIRSEVTAGSMVTPGLALRQHPFALPYPCNRTHTVEIEFAGLNQTTVPLFQVGNQYFTFNRRSRCWPNFLKITFALETLGDSIPPEKIAEHRKHVEALQEASVVNLQLPSGYSRARKRSNFGALPPPNPSRAGVSSVVVMTQKPVAASPGTDVPVAAPVPESVAIQKTAELAGMAPVMPMPPAVDSSRLQSATEQPPPSHRRSREKKMEKRCLFSFFIFMASLTGNFIAMFLGRADSTAAIGGLLALLVIPSLIWSLILAGLGWRQCAKHPGRYLDSKVFAVLTLLFGGLFALALVPEMIHGTRSVMAGARARRQVSYSNREPVELTNQNFIFHPPAAPWTQTGARSFGVASTMFAFARPEPMFFTLVSAKLDTGFVDPQKRVVELSKADLERSTTSYRLLNEMDVTYNNLAGRQLEAEAFYKGHDCYFVQWLLATNGFAYQFTTWGPPELKSQVKDEANRLAENFELAQPHH